MSMRNYDEVKARQFLSLVDNEWTYISAADQKRRIEAVLSLVLGWQYGVEKIPQSQ